MEFQNVFEKSIIQLQETEQTIILFGCGLLGKLAVAAINYFKKTKVYYCDNDVKKQGTVVDGIDVLSPTEAFEKYSEAKVYLCLFRKSAKESLTKQLSDIGFTDINDGLILLGAYNIFVLERGFSEEQYLCALENLDENAESYVGNICLVMTEKCTLRCAECSGFMPYYKAPVHHGAEMVIHTMQSLGDAVKTIKNVAVLGGEPFLHPELVKICQEIAKIPGIINISITTNGTIVPSCDILKELKKVVSYISISDYDKFSIRKRELIQALEEVNMPYLVLEDNLEWYKQNMPVPHHRGSENDEIFRTCYWSNTAAKIINGQYHRCDYSAGLTPFHMLPDNEGDFVDLLQKDKEKMKEELYALIHRKHCLKACDYCEIFCTEKTKKAEQAKGILEFTGK